MILDHVMFRYAISRLSAIYFSKIILEYRKKNVKKGKIKNRAFQKLLFFALGSSKLEPEKMYKIRKSVLSICMGGSFEGASLMPHQRDRKAVYK